MKKFLNYLPALVLIAVLFSSCLPEENFDEALLIGKWQSGTLFYRYDTGGTGVSWDTSDDITEAEAQAFTWTLVKAELTHIHVIEMIGNVPKVYTVTKLTETILEYKDDFDNQFSFTKVVQ
ncbi:hypothetical protein SDC9_200139 [bioreactor metagenome]|uniref:Lipocalin-like domain-containing protein n=1 Tax=bioreactor metagenome TaxID=1076179 RepID=A0A645IMJ1_9ZZZZ|nr:hypothetical protein [Paludibacter sp.]